MTDQAMLDRAHYSIMQRIINTGQAPHYTEMATELGLRERRPRSARNGPVVYAFGASRGCPRHGSGVINRSRVRVRGSGEGLVSRFGPWNW